MDINNIAHCLLNTTFISDNRKPKDRVVIPTTAEVPGEAVLLTGQGLSTQGLTRKEQPDPVPSFSWHGCPAHISTRAQYRPSPSLLPHQQSQHQMKAKLVVMVVTSATL